MRNKSEALKYYQEASKLGDAEALNNIGIMLEEGYDLNLPSPESAVSYY